MDSYKILEHPADVKVQVFGKTKEELFLNALKGMTAVLRPEIRNPNIEIRNKIKVKSIDIDNLLVDFLSEVLYLSQINKRAYNNIKFFKFSDTPAGAGQASLEGELSGHNIESFGEDIKGVTYHGLKIEKKDGLYQATILFDI
jgi:SHS2 domain-containing protein